MEPKSDGRHQAGIFDLRYEERTDYLYVFIRGEIEEVDEAIQAWATIANECRRREYRKLLIEEDMRTQLSVLDMFTFASKLPEIGFIGIKIAFVDRQFDDHPENRFGENVAANRGIQISVFRNREDAERWLLSS